MAPSDWYLTYTKIGVYAPWTCLFKAWSGKRGFLADAKIEDFSFINKKSHVDKIYNFQLFVDFSTDLKSPAIKFLKTGFKSVYIFL